MSKVLFDKLFIINMRKIVQREFLLQTNTHYAAVTSINYALIILTEMLFFFEKFFCNI
jgi:hypothetical protein